MADLKAQITANDGGDGGIRRARFLEPMTARILSNGRVHGTFGTIGNQAGQLRTNRVVRWDGAVEVLGHIGQTEVAVWDVFAILTPGGWLWAATEVTLLSLFKLHFLDGQGLAAYFLCKCCDRLTADIGGLN